MANGGAIRVYHLVRDEDESGVSGTGTVAEVFEASDGVCIVRWLSNMSSTNIYNNFKQVEQIHGHEGKTRLVKVYDESPLPEPEDEVIRVAEEDEDKPEKSKSKSKAKRKSKKS